MKNKKIRNLSYEQNFPFGQKLCSNKNVSLKIVGKKYLPLSFPCSRKIPIRSLFCSLTSNFISWTKILFKDPNFLAILVLSLKALMFHIEGISIQLNCIPVKPSEDLKSHHQFLSHLVIQNFEFPT